MFHVKHRPPSATTPAGVAAICRDGCARCERRVARLPDLGRGPGRWRLRAWEADEAWLAKG